LIGQDLIAEDLIMEEKPFPILRPIADTGVLVEFGNVIDDAVLDRVLSFDAIIQKAEITGLTECVPSSTCVLVGYDPLQTDSDLICQQIEKCLSIEQPNTLQPTHWQIPTCYAESLAPDLGAVASHVGISEHDVIEQHCSGNYKIYMYGFAPGYAYMGGVPKSIQLPRKAGPVMNVPAQTVMIAGPQCLITTLAMPTGWWRIGLTTFKPLQMSRSNPFLLNVGDTLEFVAMTESDFNQHSAAS